MKYPVIYTPYIYNNISDPCLFFASVQLKNGRAFLHFYGLFLSSLFVFLFVEGDEKYLWYGRQKCNLRMWDEINKWVKQPKTYRIDICNIGYNMIIQPSQSRRAPHHFALFFRINRTSRNAWRHFLRSRSAHSEHRELLLMLSRKTIPKKDYFHSFFIFLPSIFAPTLIWLFSLTNIIIMARQKLRNERI